MKQSQKLLLTWLIEDTGLFDIVKQYITPEDFTEEIYKKAAEILYAQFAEGALNPGKIVSMFQNEEEQREIAALFNARIHEIDGKQEREKALKETILRVKENSYNYRAAHIAVTDIAGTQKLIDDKRQLEALRKLHISIN
ncbi:dNA primase [Roseburia sp. CAG:182]|nr:dNA primase [Roseburia sp. CAG:182]